MDATEQAIWDKGVEAIYEMRPGFDDDITENTDPIADLGLDSPEGLDFALRLSKKLGWTIPHDVNPFVDDDKTRSRKFGEIIELISGLMVKEATHARA